MQDKTQQNNPKRKGRGKSQNNVRRKGYIPVKRAVAVIIFAMAAGGILVGSAIMLAFRPITASREAMLAGASSHAGDPYYTNGDLGANDSETAMLTYPPYDNLTNPSASDPDINSINPLHNDLYTGPYTGPFAEPEYWPYSAGPEVVSITISAAGDVTLGGDHRWNSYNNFMGEFERNNRDHGYFFRNVRHIFEASDLSIVNLEGALTYERYHRDQQFVFRGPPHFARILTYGNIDIVTLANNHTMDFHRRGYLDTIAALEAEGIAYFGNEFNTILEIKGIQIGLFGFSIWNDGQYNRDRITAAIEDLRYRGAQLVIAYFHWGVERSNMPNQVQRTMGQFAVRYGADLVLGAHPHVIQGIEVYQGRNIVYSLSDFSFGGNRFPVDLDTFIFQQTFHFEEGVLMDSNETNIIPASRSSVRNYNNYQPTPAEGTEAERILQRIRTYSERIGS